MKKLFCLVCSLGIPALSSWANMVIAPWNPIFKGIEHARGTNFPDAAIPRLQVMNALRIDLRDPDVQLFVSPQAPNFRFEMNETRSLIISNFIRYYGVKVATDCNFYTAFPGGADPSSEGVPCEVSGSLICTGTVVSVPDNRYATFFFDSDKNPTINYNNRNSNNTPLGTWTSLTGYYPVLSNGIIRNDLSTAYPHPTIHGAQPRTCFGLSQDRRYLFAVTIDGRQAGYSEGALDQEAALWLQYMGAWDAINMDGGGSTAMYMADCAGNPIPLNRSSYVAAYPNMRRERVIGCHFGVFAPELSSFISGVSATPGGISAIITWTTLSNATSQVEYGLTPAYGAVSTLDPSPVVNHHVQLTGLTPGTKYYYRVISVTDIAQHSSGCGAPFTTTNPLTATIFTYTNMWQYSIDNLDAVPWNSPTYDDQFWSNGLGVLWVDTVYPSGNSAIQFLPLRTRMPSNPATGKPYITYYFRTHFTFSENTAGVVLTFTNYFDDGAAFYLNGNQIHRAFLPDPAYNNTPAHGYPCPSTGNATCPYVFTISGDLITNLVQGDNVVAVEVHNYSTTGTFGPDITFGCDLTYVAPAPTPPFIYNLAASSGLTNATISWLTLSNATAQVVYGLTPAYGSATPLDPILTTSHAFTLTGLEEATNYYFRVVSSVGSTQWVADSTFSTFYAPLVGLTNSWIYSTNNLDGIIWQDPRFTETNWPGGPALLWADRRSDAPPEVQPRNTRMPINNATLNPYTTYYFRTCFTNPRPVAGYALVFSNFVDDGAVFYLNGNEIYRLRMPLLPIVISNGTYATGQPFGDDATQADVFRLGADRLAGLVVGPNLLAVEVHNFTNTSPDIIFGASVGFVPASAAEIKLRVTFEDNVVTVAWDGKACTLQQTSDLTASGTWSDVPGPVRASPYCVTNPVGNTFYRLRD